MNKSILLKAADELTYLALRRTAVLTDELRGVEYHRPEQQLRYSDKLPTSTDILVIGKEHYREENRVLPIASRREVSKVLALECAANEDDVMVYRIGDYVDGERNVVLWSCAKTVLAKYNVKPLLVIPEGLLLLNAEPNRLITLKRESQTFWFYDRQGHFLSAAKKGLISNATMFKASAGLADGIESAQIDSSNYLSKVFSPSAKVLATHLLGLKTSLRRLQPVDLREYAKYCGLSAVVMLTSYFALTSLYLQLRLDAAESASSQYSGKTNEIFALKKQLTKAEQQQVQLAEISGQSGAPSVVWRLLAPLIQRGVKIDRLSYLPDGLFIVNGVANKDTEVLEFLNSDELVLQPQLRAATRTVKGKDHFSISLKIKGSK